MSVSSKLADLERAQDEATLEFWEAITMRDEAQERYAFAEKNMLATKAAYLREKLKPEAGAGPCAAGEPQL